MSEETLFQQALELPPAERAAFLDRECPDPALRIRIEALLAADLATDVTTAQSLNAAADHPQANPATASYRQTSEAEGTVIAGRYKLRQQIGEGGMGTVWMATQTEPIKRQVAVKLIRAERGQSKTILARFEAERQAIALMDHPHIAKLLDAGTTEDGAPFFVMELVKGIPLHEFCDQHQLTIPERLTLFMQICSAVQHAHQKGIIHRDLKPSNILVESHDGKPVPKVIDFGLAKATTGLQLTENTLHTGFGAVLGTPLYMAPEQANLNALDVDTRADIYALGVILYELLTGTTPITRETLKQAALDEMLRLIREQEAPTPSSRLSSSASAPSVAANRHTEPAKLGRFIRGELDWIVMKALAKERERRYETANGFARDIERFLNHEPVSAGPPSAAYRIQKFLRRHRGPVLAASLVLLALVGGIIGTTWGLLQARQEAEQKERQRGIAEERLIQVETEKQRTEEQKRIAEAVNDFLQNKLLAQADTAQQADSLLEAGELSSDAKYNPTIRELLDRAAKELAPDKIESSFPQQPLVQAQILRTVGNSYRGIGETTIAIDFLVRSVELHCSQLGKEDPETLHVMSNLTEAYREAGLLDKALPLYEETFRLRKSILGPDHLQTLVSMNDLALGYHEIGEFQKSIALDEEVLRLRKAKLGPDHPHTLDSMNNLAEGYKTAGQLDKAIPMLEETLRLVKHKLGLDHPVTLNSMNNLAEAYRHGGQLDKALPLLEETLKLRKIKQGSDHPDTLVSMNNLALGYHEVGEFQKSIALDEETLQIRKVKLGPDHPHTLDSMNNLAEGYKAAGQLDKALSLLEETLKLTRKKLGPNHPNTLLSMNNLAEAYRRTQQFAQALTLLEQTLELSKSILGPEHPETLICMNNLALTYLALGEIQKSIALDEETLRIRKIKLGFDHPNTLTSMNNLAGGYRAAGKLDQAIALLEESLRLTKAKLGSEHPYALPHTNNLAKCYELAGMREQAITHYENAMQLSNTKLGPNHPNTINTMGNLVKAYLDAKQAEKATQIIQAFVASTRRQSPKNSPEFAGLLAQISLDLLKAEQFTTAQEMLRECLAIREKTQPDSWTTFNTMSLLGEALSGQKKYADAEPLLVKGYEGMKTREKTIPPQANTRIPEALDRLIDLYTAQEKPDEVKKYQDLRAKYPPAANEKK